MTERLKQFTRDIDQNHVLTFPYQFDQWKLDARMSFNKTTENQVRKSKWGAFNDHMCTLIETNTV